MLMGTAMNSDATEGSLNIMSARKQLCYGLDLRQGIAILLMAVTLILTMVMFPRFVNAQARVDLEDLSVKGELLNDNRLKMSAREATHMQDRIHYRKNFRPEILDEIEFRMPAAEGAPAAAAEPIPGSLESEPEGP